MVRDYYTLVMYVEEGDLYISKTLGLKAALFSSISLSKDIYKEEAPLNDWLIIIVLQGKPQKMD